MTIYVITAVSIAAGILIIEQVKEIRDEVR